MGVESILLPQNQKFPFNFNDEEQNVEQNSIFVCSLRLVAPRLEKCGCIMKSEWFVVQTNPQRETTAADRLSEHDPYFPRFKAPSGRIKPLFPGYLFCRATDLWGSIKNAIGVKTVLMQGDAPARLPDNLIELWRCQEVAGLVQLPDPPRFKIGERLIVLSGSLKNRVVIHAGMSAKNREMVLIEMLGAQVRISIETVDLTTELEQIAAERLRENRKRIIRQRARSF
jgi:transcription antitermination factor NusG